MSPVDPTGLPASSLRDALITTARGLYREEAAVQLLIDHGVWLNRADFLATCVEVDDEGWTRDGTATLASIDWDAARLLAESVPGARSEAAVLHLAAGIAEGQLGGFVAVLDQTNVGLVLDALAHAAGWHERGASRLVTGGAR